MIFLVSLQVTDVQGAQLGNTAPSLETAAERAPAVQRAAANRDFLPLNWMDASVWLAQRGNLPRVFVSAFLSV